MTATERIVMTPADQVRPGDLVDLAYDHYADPNHDGSCTCEPDCGHWYAFHFEQTEILTHDFDGVSTLLGFDGGVIAFPPDHYLPVIKDERTTS